MNDITVSNEHSFYATASKVKQDVILCKNVGYRMQDMNHYIHLFLLKNIVIQSKQLKFDISKI